VRRRRPRRRLRIRRKRKGEEFLKGALEGAGDAAANHVIGEFGGCVVEAIGSAAVLLALLTVPAYLMLIRVT
jgi:hypothetical protein